MRAGFIALLACCASLAQAAPLAPTDLIDLAGRQRMLSQRIVKAYAQVGIGVMTAQSQQILTASLDRFARQLEELRAAPAPADQRATLAAIERIWPRLQRLSTAAVDRRNAPQLQADADELQRLSHRLVNLIEQENGLVAGRLVNLAGRQRMLTQRLAKAYMLRVWQVDAGDLAQETEKARIEFAAALELLAAAPENTAAIERELAALAVQWQWFQSALEMEGAHSYRLLVADASEAILGSLERLVALYARLDGN
jgi:hypothetical protein